MARDGILTPRSIARYGCKPSLPDPRNRALALTADELGAPFPYEFSLRDKMPPVYDQGQLGSCTANAIAGAVQYQQLRQGEPEGEQTPSRLFIYYCERALEGTVASDSGAAIFDGIKVVAKLGAPPETEWPYDISQFTVQPPANVYADALNFRAISYAQPIRTAYYLRRVLSVGRPFVFGFIVYQSFETGIGADGVMPMPDTATEQVMGGHAVVAIGYRWINGHLYFEVRNSWGPGFGDSGYFYMPAEYLLDGSLCWDFWDIKLEA